MIPAPERRDYATSETPFISNDLDWYKRQAKRLRNFLRVLGIDIKHGHALDAVAGIHGLKNYNTLVGMAKAGKTPIECLDECMRSVRRGEFLRKYLLAGGMEITQGQAQEFIALISPDKREHGPTR